MRFFGKNTIRIIESRSHEYRLVPGTLMIFLASKNNIPFHLSATSSHDHWWILNYEYEWDESVLFYAVFVEMRFGHLRRKFQLHDVSASIMSCFIKFTVCMLSQMVYFKRVSKRSPAAHVGQHKSIQCIRLHAFLYFVIFSQQHISFKQVEWWIHLSYHDFCVCVSFFLLFFSTIFFGVFFGNR